MALRFIKTSILTSSDGIDFADETAVESEEVRWLLHRVVTLS
jgi:hypothetical protein